MVKGAATIAEYKVKKWMEQEGFILDCFSLEINDNYEVIITDDDGETMELIYDPKDKSVTPID